MLKGAFAQSYSPPSYIGGDSAFTTYILKYVYMDLPLHKNFSQDFNYTIYISKEGDVRFVNVLGKDPDIRAEMKRALKLCGKWNPGRLNGMAIDTSITNVIRVCSDVDGKANCKSDTLVKVLEVIRYSVLVREPNTIYDTMEHIAPKLFNDGKYLFSKSRYSEALTAFQKSEKFGYHPRSEVYYNIAACYIMLNKKEDACVNLLESARYGDEDALKEYNKRCK